MNTSTPAELVRVLVFKGQRAWIAQSIEGRYAVQGRSAGHAFAQMVQTFGRLVESNHPRDVLRLTAPEPYTQAYEQARPARTELVGCPKPVSRLFKLEFRTAAEGWKPPS